MQKSGSRIESQIQSGENVLIMAVGDSITFGLNHCTAEQTYCAELARLLAARYPAATVLRYDGLVADGMSPLKGFSEPQTVHEGKRGTITVVRNGIGGNTVRRALNRAGDFTGAFITGEKPDVYLLMFGINDALAEDPLKYVSHEQYYLDLLELYNLLRLDNPTAEIVFMTPTYNDLGDTDESHLEPYCREMMRLAAEKDCQCIDTHALWMSHLIVGTEHYGQRDWLSNTLGDACHFSPTGSRETAKFIFDELFR